MSTLTQDQDVDFSAGLVPKAAPARAQGSPDQDVDFSAGLVPKAASASPAEPEEKPGFFKGAYDTTVGPVVDLAKREAEYLAKTSPDAPISEFGNDPVVQALHGIVKSHAEVAHKAIDAIRNAGAGYGRAVQGAVTGDMNTANTEAQSAGAEATKGMGYGLAAIVPGVGPAAAKVGEDYAENPRYAAGETAGLLTSSILGAKGAKGVADTSEAIPPSETIAGTEIPLTVGQGMTKANPNGVGPFVQGAESMAKGLPFSKGLKRVAAEQQAGAREILAGKAGQTGAEVSTAPDAIEQNFANAVEKTRQEGSAKYEAIADAAKDADLPVAAKAASDILGDPDTAKLLPPSARNALAKIGSAANELDAISRQIYGRAASTLDSDELANVKKAQATAPGANFPSVSGGAMRGVMDARTELADAAHGVKDPADKFRIGQALDKFDTAVNDSLKAHDEANGTNLRQDLQDARQLWTQKYATQAWLQGLQGIMRGAPSEGIREINGAAFQKLVNKLDPLGGAVKGKSTLQRMFPGDPQSVADIHQLADFMGRNQAKAGGFGSMMARMKVVGLSKAAIPFMANAAGFSALMSRPGFAGTLLKAFRAGSDTAKLATAVASINQLVGEGGSENSRANAGDSAAIQPGTANAEGLPTTSVTALPSTRNGSNTTAETNAAIDTNQPNSTLPSTPQIATIAGSSTNPQNKNSVTPAANLNPNSIAEQATPPPQPPLVPGSGTNGIRKDTPGVPQISRHDASPDQIAELAHNTVAVANEEAQAHRIASGLPPVPPPPPAPPPPAPGVVSPDMVSAMGKKIAGMPPEQRAQATSEAHHELAQALLQQGKVSGPDGKIEIITKPEQADKIAQRIINDELKKQDKESGQTGAGVATTAPAPTSTFRPSWKVVSSAPAQPPADLWKGKENKRLTLKDANGKTSRWELVKGVPKMVD